MIRDLNTVNIYLKPGFTDMRKQINGLSVLVAEQWKINPFTGGLFVFCGKDRRSLKILYWDKNGFCLWQKKLAQHRFPWPKDGSEVCQLSGEKLEWLLAGIDFWNAHQELFYKNVG